jgi:hypothetical protein
MQNEADLLDTDLLPIRTVEEIPPDVCEAAPIEAVDRTGRRGILFRHSLSRILS